MRCEHCEELQEQVRQLRALLVPSKRFPDEWGLTPTENILLAVLVSKGRARREACVAAVSKPGREEPGPRIVDTCISRIRVKLRKQKLDVKIRAVVSEGYLIEKDDANLLKSFMIGDNHFDSCNLQ